MKYLIFFFLFLALLSCSSDAPSTFVLEQAQEACRLSEYHYLEDKAVFQERAADKSEPMVSERMQLWLQRLEQVEQSQREVLQELNVLKMAVAQAEGWSVLKPEDNKDAVRLDFGKLGGTATFDLSGKLVRLQHCFETFQLDAMRGVSDREIGGKQQHLVVPVPKVGLGMSATQEKKQWVKQIERALAQQHILQDDWWILTAVYVETSFSNDFWKQHAVEQSSREALLFLLGLEQRLNNAMGIVAEGLKSQFGCLAEVSLRDFGVQTTLPDTVYGSKVQFSVFVGGISSQPVTQSTCPQAKFLGIKNGMALYELSVAKSGKQLLEGTLVVENKSGVKRVMKWRKEVKIEDDRRKSGY